MLKRFFPALILLVCSCAVAEAAPLKALIITGQDRAHKWAETTPLLKRWLEETGLFSVDVLISPGYGGDFSKFNTEFSKYDVTVMNYGFGGDPWPQKVKKALDDYMKSGGGLVIYHAANNAFPKWKEYNEMIGLGGWGGRNEKDGPYIRWRDGKVVRDMTPGPGGSHGPQHEFVIEVRDAEHPITKGLPPKFMHSADELYNRLRGPAKNLTVLATAYSPKEKSGTGENEPILMTIKYGKGRVFHTAFGHGAKHLKSVAFIVTFQRGTEWAASGKVTQKVPADMPGADKPVLRK
ncbi:MAG: ThuA domain-containing protein [Pirellulales bacterium]|nr:ThuA domain-containing protein [Pirellulales bacterium]